MRIEGNRPNLGLYANERADATRTERTDAPGRGAKAGASTGTSGSGDVRLDLSAEAQFVSTVIRAAQNAPVIRQDLVEQMRQKVAAGDVGKDLGRLADRMMAQMSAQ
jgi:flagellar biosynthesis anti-sigma factor FlgM